ncbi:hypothetical protein [Vibrio astriarenae]|uniref:hypothetical protein n=1 Tax=Vibrio astriarenae TaxID=1481923 RepID=UPI003734FD1E
MCLTKNVGISQATCPLHAAPNPSEYVSTSQISEIDESTEHCDLSGHLLQNHLSSIDFVALVSFALAIAIIAWIASLANPIPTFTEPIVSPIRLHKRHCVFRE